MDKLCYIDRLIALAFVWKGGCDIMICSGVSRYQIVLIHNHCVHVGYCCPCNGGKEEQRLLTIQCCVLECSLKPYKYTSPNMVTAGW